MKEIKLTQGQVAIVDDVDFDYLNQWKWFAIKGKETFYAVRSNELRIRIWMHRIIMSVSNRSFQVDHKDHNGLNNQRGNLRIATSAQNSYNKKPRPNSSSKYLGVNWDKNCKRWYAQIKKGKKKTYLGIFKDEKDAAIAYNNEAVKRYGEFANLNVL